MTDRIGRDAGETLPGPSRRQLLAADPATSVVQRAAAMGGDAGLATPVQALPAAATSRPAAPEGAGLGTKTGQALDVSPRDLCPAGRHGRSEQRRRPGLRAYRVVIQRGRQVPAGPVIEFPAGPILAVWFTETAMLTDPHSHGNDPCPRPALARDLHDDRHVPWRPMPSS